MIGSMMVAIFLAGVATGVILVIALAHGAKDRKRFAVAPNRRDFYVYSDASIRSGQSGYGFVILDTNGKEVLRDSRRGIDTKSSTAAELWGISKALDSLYLYALSANIKLGKIYVRCDSEVAIRSLMKPKPLSVGDNRPVDVIGIVEEAKSNGATLVPEWIRGHQKASVGGAAVHNRTSDWLAKQVFSPQQKTRRRK